jgi:hypothetical protein
MVELLMTVGEEAVLSVRDNGTGIKDPSAIFEPFYTTKKQGEGVGLGLAISAGIMAGRTVTSTPGIKDDLTNAGATWVDRAVVTDGHIISARRPPDLPAFGGAMIDFLSNNPVK